MSLHEPSTNPPRRAAADSAAAGAVRRRDTINGVLCGAAHYYLTSGVVLIGALFGFSFVKVCREHGSAKRGEFAESLAAWDGVWYARIVSDGYSYDSERRSSVAFYPGYPCLASAVASVNGWSPVASLLVVSHGCLLGAFVVLYSYVRIRRSGAAPDVAEHALVAFGLFPTTFYFRMAYSESLFLLVTVTAMLAMERKWPTAVIALVIGAATATRAVGVALLVPFAMYLWRESPSLLAIAWRSALFLPLACWGLAAWAAYQAYVFDEPLAFIKTQRHWNTVEVSAASADGVTRLVTARPLRAVYDAGSPCYWGRRPPRDNPLFNMMFANPIYLALTALLICLGAWKRWLTGRELALSAMLLLIPYVLQADRGCMAAQARYASAVFPAYIVLGQFLGRIPAPVSALLATLSGTMLAAYSALFVSWYWFY